MSPIRPFAALALACAATAPLAAQVPAAEPEPQVTPPATAEPDDIVVEGYRRSKPPEARIGIPGSTSSVTSRVIYSYSKRLADCAVRSRLSSLSRLRVVVDGEVNSPRLRMAQDRLVRNYITCGESAVLLGFSSVPHSLGAVGGSVTGGRVVDERGPVGWAAPDPAPLGWSIYDRGALVIAAMQRFAPDLALTKAQVDDPAVQERFHLREAPRNRLRLPLDGRYFEVTACIVREQPRLAVRLALGDGPARLGDVQEALIDRSRACFGGARRVRVDPTQFRLYIADSVYRWAVAAQGVGSLIPSDAQLAAR